MLNFDFFNSAIDINVAFDEVDDSYTSFKAGLEYTPNDNVLVYTSWSEGFRLGFGVSEVPPTTAAFCDIDNDGFYDGSNGVSVGPRSIDSDYVENFELGGKFSLLDSQLVFNAAIFQINWEGIPVNEFFSPLCFLCSFKPLPFCFA